MGDHERADTSYEQPVSLALAMGTDYDQICLDLFSKGNHFAAGMTVFKVGGKGDTFGSGLGLCLLKNRFSFFLENRVVSSTVLSAGSEEKRPVSTT